MDKQIPIYFDSVIIDSPFQGISETNPNIGRLKVRVFTKYGNRNGSYITEAVAQQLIDSATQGMTPVVGFFDPETQSWASHSGPTLANAYGYVEDFLGWEPFTDTDGVTREYAVFSVILFTDYFEEANKILGQNQSMELDPASITGDWTLIENEEFYVYKTAKMLGFCVIGEHEPCFSVSAFFSKNDNTYSSQFEKFSSLLSNLKAQVEEAKKSDKGGEQPMNEFENQEQTNEVLETENLVVEESAQQEEAPQSFEEENNATVVEETVTVEESTTVEESAAEPAPDYEALYNDLQTKYEEAQNHIAELEQFQETANADIEAKTSRIAELETSIEQYEAQAKAIEDAQKENLIKKYERELSAEEINSIREKVNDLSYEELNSKLAIAFAAKKMVDNEIEKVPLPEQPESQFASFMKKYKKN